MRLLSITLRRRTFRSLRRHRNYRLFFAGQVVSVAGTWMQNIALAWLVIELSTSPLAVGALAFCRFVPFFLFGLVAGVVIDRLDTRRLLLATQAAAMVVSIALAVVTLSGWATLPVVYALAAIGGLVLVFDAPGRQTLTFQMVGESELQNAVALNSGLFNASRVIGPALAGLLIAVVGTGLCFVVNAISFLAVLVALYLIREDELYPVEKRPGTKVVAGIREGLAWAAHTPLARIVLCVVTVVSLVGFNFNVLVPLLASQTLDVGAGTFGLLSAAFGLGALGGALAHGQHARGESAGLRRRRGRLQPRHARARVRPLGRRRARAPPAARHVVLLLHLERQRARPARLAAASARARDEPLPVRLCRARPDRRPRRGLPRRAGRNGARVRPRGRRRPPCHRMGGLLPVLGASAARPGRGVTGQHRCVTVPVGIART